MKQLLILFSIALSLAAQEIPKIKIAIDKKITIEKIEDSKLNRYSFSIKDRKIPPFYIAKYETSVGEYIEYLKGTKQEKKMRKFQLLEVDSEPITNIDFDEASRVCHYFKGRLPSEFEWVVAASIKVAKSLCYEELPKGTFSRYATENFPLNKRVFECMLEDDDELEMELIGSELSDVEESVENINATYGMLGNVWEWVDTDRVYFKENYKVIKGGSFANFTMPKLFDSRVSNYVKRETKMQNIGFRCVWDPEK